MTQAQRSLVTMGVLVVAACAVGAYAYFGVHKAEVAEQERKDTEARAFSFDREKVRAVTLTSNGVTTELEKEGDAWRIVSPVKARADRYAVDAIINKLHDLRSQEVIAENQSAKSDFGLDAPPLRVRLALDGGEERVLEVGEQNPYDQSFPYATSGDGRIFSADSGLKWPLDKSLFDLRDKAIVTHEDSEVRALVVESAAGQAWSVERDGDGWRLTSPVSDQADRRAIDSVLSKLRGARARAFLLEEPGDAKELATYGLDTPSLVVTFALGEDRAKRTLHAGEVTKDGETKVYVRLVEGGPVMEVDGAFISGVAMPVAALRDKSIATFDREKAARIEIAPLDGETLVVTRSVKRLDGQDHESEEFAIEGRSDRVKTWTLSSMLYGLSALEGHELVEDDAKDLALYGLDAPRVSWTVQDASGAELARVLIGSEIGPTRVYAMKGGTRRVYVAEKATLDDLPRTLADIVEAPAASPDPSASAPLQE